MKRRGGFVPLGSEDPARSIMSPARAPVARTYNNALRLRSAGKEACNPAVWEDLKFVRRFSDHRRGEPGRGSMTYAPQRVHTHRG